MLLFIFLWLSPGRPHTLYNSSRCLTSFSSEIIYLLFYNYDLGWFLFYRLHLQQFLVTVWLTTKCSWAEDNMMYNFLSFLSLILSFLGCSCARIWAKKLYLSGRDMTWNRKALQLSLLAQKGKVQHHRFPSKMYCNLQKHQNWQRKWIVLFHLKHNYTKKIKSINSNCIGL